jgi:hypothetical protein
MLAGQGSRSSLWAWSFRGAAGSRSHSRRPSHFFQRSVCWASVFMRLAGSKRNLSWQKVHAERTQSRLYCSRQGHCEGPEGTGVIATILLILNLIGRPTRTAIRPMYEVYFEKKSDNVVQKQLLVSESPPRQCKIMSLGFNNFDIFLATHPFLLRLGVRAASYPELWILRYPTHRYRAVPSPGFEPTTLWSSVRRPNHSATTLHPPIGNVNKFRFCIRDQILRTLLTLGPF